MKTYLTNARVILDEEVIEGGVVLEGSVISQVLTDTGSGDALDCDGDYLLPGLIDIHTDNLEIHAHPRPTVQWPNMLNAVLAHDWQVLGSGITTVLDAVALGDFHSGGKRNAMVGRTIAALDEARGLGLLKADHFLHLRCELCDQHLMSMVDRHIDDPSVKLVSFMDHTPGQRQWADTDRFREYYRKKGTATWTDAEFSTALEGWRQLQSEIVPKHRADLAKQCRARGITIASHDDTTLEDVLESHKDSIKISEFPTTVAAAKAARENGMRTVMGSPNVVLGGSHSGNVAATDLADLGLLDMLTSDYVPGSLLQACFILAERGMTLPQAVALVTSTPTDLLGLRDRGRIASGLRADIIRVRLVNGVAVIRNIWAAGRQIM